MLYNSVTRFYLYLTANFYIRNLFKSVIKGKKKKALCRHQGASNTSFNNRLYLILWCNQERKNTPVICRAVAIRLVARETGEKEVRWKLSSFVRHLGSKSAFVCTRAWRYDQSQNGGSCFAKLARDKNTVRGRALERPAAGEKLRLLLLRFSPDYTE